MHDARQKGYKGEQDICLVNQCLGAFNTLKLYFLGASLALTVTSGAQLKGSGLQLPLKW